MTLQELEMQREELCTLMIEAEGSKLRDLERQLLWIEELIQELELEYGEEN